MGYLLGESVQLGVGQEAVRGTGVTPTAWLPARTPSGIRVVVDKVLVQETRASRITSQGSEITHWETYFKDGSRLLSGTATELLNPILLTEEWLLKFGFIKLGYNYEFWDSSMWSVKQHKNKNSWWLLSCNEEVDCIRLNYVHQLQNLYFALTGEELKLKQNEAEQPKSIL